jgi:trimeric autotransporter adhesin
MDREDAPRESSEVKQLTVAAVFGLIAAGAIAPPAAADVGPSSTITALAGQCESPGFAGDGGPSTQSLVNQPRDTAIGPDGSVYVADTYNNRIRRISTGGTITTVVGSGSAVYNGDEIPATQASLKWPHDLFVDADGNIFIADSNHNRVREVTTDGIIHTVAGTGTAGYSGDGGLATAAQLKNPKSVFLYSGYLYIADLSNTIRRVDMSTGIITTYGGRGLTAGYANGDRLSALFDAPQRIQVDSNGNLYIADTNNHAIRRIDAATGQVTTVAGTGAPGFNSATGRATKVKLNHPRGIALKGDDVLFVADSDNDRIRRVNLRTGKLTTIAGSTQGCGGDGGPASDATFDQPRGLTIDATGNLIVADTFNSMLREIASS